MFKPPNLENIDSFFFLTAATSNMERPGSVATNEIYFFKSFIASTKEVVKTLTSLWTLISAAMMVQDDSRTLQWVHGFLFLSPLLFWSERDPKNGRGPKRTTVDYFCSLKYVKLSKVDVAWHLFLTQTQRNKRGEIRVNSVAALTLSPNTHTQTHTNTDTHSSARKCRYRCHI